jgi:SAM-dependent methyltransferase
LFQAVVGLDIFEHVDQDREAIAEAYRVLKPGGILVLSVPAFRALWGPHDVALHHHRRYTQDEMELILRDRGFEIVQISYAVFWLFPLVVLSRIVEKFKRGPARASLPRVSDWMNRTLIALLAWEGKMLWSGKLKRYPWGSSVVAVARKPR